LEAGILDPGMLLLQCIYRTRTPTHTRNGPRITTAVAGRLLYCSQARWHKYFINILKNTALLFT
jgi:hypothetical protein